MGSKTAQPGIPSSVSTSVPNTGTPSGGGQPPSFPGQQPQPQSQQPQPQVQPQQVDPTASSGQPAAGRFSISPVVESRPITQTGNYNYLALAPPPHVEFPRTNN